MAQKGKIFGRKRSTYDGYEDCIMGEIIGYDGYRLTDKQIGTINLEIINKYYASLATIYSAGTIKKKQDIFHVLPDMYPYSVGSSDGAIRSESSLTMSSDGFNNSVKNSVP